jgi:hypothetical protein
MRNLIATIMILMSSVCWAHPGRTDSSGGHNDRRNGGYHYHNEEPSTQPVEILPAIRQSAFIPVPRTSARTTARSTARTTSQERDAREQYAQDYKPSNSPVTFLTTIEKPAVDRERQAQGKLRLGKQWIDKGRPADATRWLKEVLEQFPETAAAKEAGPLYQKATGHKFERDLTQ